MAYDEDLADRIRELVAAERGVEEKRMFGGLAFLINGNMAVSASSKGGLLLRVDPAQTGSLVAEPHASRFDKKDSGDFLALSEQRLISSERTSIESLFIEP